MKTKVSILGIIGTVMLVLGFLFTFFIMPQINKVESLRAEVSTVATKNATQDAQIDGIKVQLNRIENKLDRILEK